MLNTTLDYNLRQSQEIKAKLPLPELQVYCSVYQSMQEHMDEQTQL